MALGCALLAGLFFVWRERTAAGINGDLLASKPLCAAITVASVRLLAPSLSMMALACALTVPNAMHSCKAIRLFGRPLAINCRISLSRSVSGVRVKLLATRAAASSQR